MATYIGFSTAYASSQNQQPEVQGPAGGTGTLKRPNQLGKKFRLVDEALVVQDLVNAFNIPIGQKVGNPKYGTTLWTFIFEPGTADVHRNIEAEVRRLANSDPRINLNSVSSFSKENGILIQLELAIAPFNQAAFLKVFFDQGTSYARIV